MKDAFSFLNKKLSISIYTKLNIQFNEINSINFYTEEKGFINLKFHILSILQNKFKYAFVLVSYPSRHYFRNHIRYKLFFFLER